MPGKRLKTVSWTPSTSADAEQQSILVARTDSGVDNVVVDAHLPADASSYDFEVEEGGSYRIELRAFDGVTWSDALVGVHNESVQPPDAPTGLEL